MGTVELWRCSECDAVAPSREWGIEAGDWDTAVCPGCGFVHRDDENSFVDSCGFVDEQLLVTPSDRDGLLA